MLTIISDLFIDLHCYCHSLFLLYTSSFSYYTGFLLLVAHFFYYHLCHIWLSFILAYIDIGVDFQPDIHVEAEKLTELKFYCPLKVQREIKPSFDEDGEDEFFEDTEELSDYEAMEYESEISSAIEAYQSDEEENRGIMAYLGDRKRFADTTGRWDCLLSVLLSA